MLGGFGGFFVDFANFRPFDIQRLRGTVLSIALHFKKKLDVRLLCLLSCVFTLADRRNLLKTPRIHPKVENYGKEQKKVGFGVNPDSTRRRVISKCSRKPSTGVGLSLIRYFLSLIRK